MIDSRYLSPDRSIALEISQPPGELRTAELVFRAHGGRQTLSGFYGVPRGPVLFSESNDIIILHEGTSSMGSWPVTFRRAENGVYERWGPDSGESLSGHLGDLLPSTVFVRRMWIRALGFVFGQRVEAQAAVSGGGPEHRIEGRLGSCTTSPREESRRFS